MENPNEDGVALPQTIQEVESLVIQLYQAGRQPQELFEIQSKLQQLQRSEFGWKIGHELLGSSNSVVRFFGALTFTVKLNTKGTFLDSGIQSSVEQSLVHWIVFYSVNKDERVVRKLTSTLALLYLTTDNLEGCISKLTFSCLGIDSSKVGGSQTVRNLDKATLSAIEGRCLVTVLWFISALAEESGKMLALSDVVREARILKAIDQDMDDIYFLTEFALQEYGRPDKAVAVREDWSDAAVLCISAWTHFQFNWCDGSIPTELSSCLTSAIGWCFESGSEESIELVADLLSSCSRAFNQAHLRSVSELLRSTWGSEQLEEVLQTGQPGQYVSLLLAYGDLTLQDLLRDFDNSDKSAAAQEIMNKMHNLLHCPGYPAIDDDVIVQAIEFWTAFVEHVEDSIGDGVSFPWIGYANDHMVRVVEQILVKVRFPPSEEWANVDTETKRAFASFRTDTRDLLQTIYRLLGTPLVQVFADRSSVSLATRSWHEVEAALFCLSALVLASNEENDRIIAALLETPLYSELARTDIDIPIRTRRTAVEFVGQYTPFFKRETRYLPRALNFLFSSLQDSMVSNEAARSVLTLCTSCRESLTTELESFFHQYEVFLTWPTANEYTIQKVAGAIASIVQALPTTTAIIAGTQRLLDFVANGIETAKNQMMNGQTEEGRSLASISIHCLSNVAKGLQSPVDLEATDETPATVELENVKTRICSIIATAHEILGHDGEIIEQICDVIKAGLTEATSSPFHLSADAVVQFIASTRVDTPRLETVLILACAFLRAHKPSNQPNIDPAVSMLLQHLTGQIQSLGDPRNDAEVAQALIDVLIRFMPEYVDVLLHLQPSSNLEAVFNFTLFSLEIPEPLPKRSAAKFWGAFLELRGEAINVDQNLLDEVLELFGAPLAAALIRQISGNATRSDLDFLSGPLMKLLKRHPQAKSWLEVGLMSREFPQTVDLAERRKFVLQLGVSNNATATKKVITSFWSLCRGLSDQYAPIR